MQSIFYSPSTSEYAGMTINKLIKLFHEKHLEWQDNQKDLNLLADVISIRTIIEVRRNWRREQDLRLGRYQKMARKRNDYRRAIQTHKIPELAQVVEWEEVARG